MSTQRTAQEAAFEQNANEYLTRAIASARNVLPHVFDLIHPGSVVDFGCGGGAWLSVCKELGIDNTLGVDGSYADRRKLLFSEKQFLAHDLQQPFMTQRQFDLCISLEVAEHIPVEASKIFVKSLTGLAPVILFSAAIPYQGGIGHVNEQWPSYWSELFSERNYLAIDCIRKSIWNKPTVDTWYKQNTILYVASSYLEANHRLRLEHEACAGLPLDLVHPLRYLAEADPRLIDPHKIPIETAWKALKLQIGRRLRTKLHWRIRRLLAI